MNLDKEIWQFAQNKPTLIVKDIVEKYPFIEEDFIYEILLKRGVFKWLSVRRELIRLKNKWKDEIRELNRKKTDKEKGYHNALIKCRQEVRKLCHSERFVAPDFDRKAIDYLQKLKKGGKK
jgi:hypothetical protein